MSIIADRRAALYIERERLQNEAAPGTVVTDEEAFASLARIKTASAELRDGVVDAIQNSVPDALES